MVFQVSDKSSSIGYLGGSADTLIVMQCGPCVQERFDRALILLKESSDIVTGLSGPVDIPASLLVFDGLMIVMNSLPSFSDIHMNISDIIVNDGKVFWIVGGS